MGIESELSSLSVIEGSIIRAYSVNPGTQTVQLRSGSTVTHGALNKMCNQNLKDLLSDRIRLELFMSSM